MGEEQTWALRKKAKKLDIDKMSHICDIGQSGLMKDFALMFYGSKKYIYFDFKRCLAGRGYQKELQQRTQKHLEKAQ